MSQPTLFKSAIQPSNKLRCDKSHSSAETTASSIAGKLLTLPKLHQQCNKDCTKPAINQERRKALIDTQVNNNTSSSNHTYKLEKNPVKNSVASNANKPQKSFPHKARIQVRF